MCLDVDVYRKESAPAAPVNNPHAARLKRYSEDIQNFSPGWEARLGLEPDEGQFKGELDVPAGWRCAIKVEASGKKRKNVEAGPEF